MSPKGKCPICYNDATTTFNGGPSQISCPQCGNFVIGDLATHVLEAWSSERRGNLSGWIRENQGVKLFEPTLHNLEHLRTPTVGEKADKLLLWLAREYPKAGTRFALFRGGVNHRIDAASGKMTASLTGDVQPQIFARMWAQDIEEALFIIITYLVREKGFLEDAQNGFFYLTPAAWSYIHTLTSKHSGSQTGFIAMWFDRSLDPAYQVIDRAIRNSGYDPLRIDRKEHNNKIDDEIIAAIRHSKFVVADFTGHRGGVYFEAGFAMGFGIPVIWLCNDEHLPEAHFDTRQYNHILWEYDKLDELDQALRARIGATIGHGPLFSGRLG